MHPDPTTTSVSTYLRSRPHPPPNLRPPFDFDAPQSFSIPSPPFRSLVCAAPTSPPITPDSNDINDHLTCVRHNTLPFDQPSIRFKDIQAFDDKMATVQAPGPVSYTGSAVPANMSQQQQQVQEVFQVSPPPKRPQTGHRRGDPRLTLARNSSR